ncbi:MAG TPA: HAD-IA family hydrolase [Steroidobacteraceae bacterium]|nr:HAD-IA family hydrolase [Steroidobacteraceae bacterium]
MKRAGRRYRTVCFDLDGTLVDTAAEIAEATNRSLEDHGLARRSVAQISAHIGLGTRELLRSVLAQIATEQPGRLASIGFDRVMMSLERHYGETAGTLAAAYAGTGEALEQLRRARISLACVTNKELRYARRVLSVTRLADFFGLVIGGDSLPQKKPHASVLRHVVEKLQGQIRETGHVGDSRIDVMAARNAGVAAWAVPYGYNGGVPIVSANPDRIFPTVLDLAAYVTRQ